MEVLSWIILALFLTATAALVTYGLHLYVLLALFIRRRRGARRRQEAVVRDYLARTEEADWPTVVTQIPIYNEADVCVRIIEAVARMQYPPGRHTIQVLDDSNDHSRELVDEAADRVRAAGVSIEVIRRPHRSGFKAGALAYGLRFTQARYVAVFDADFVPPPDFLRKAIPLLEASPDLACLQGRWAHLNRNESWLTQAQALGLDGHFAIEQGARAWNGLMMNFNGTAGVWRRAAIEDPRVGGWNGDTLTEDLDLSYRAQLAGWRIDYCLDLTCPAELPGSIAALKGQQRRWAVGSIQVARKLLPTIWRSGCSLGEKVEATLHLTQHLVSVWVLVLALISRPMLFVFNGEAAHSYWFWGSWILIFFSAVAPSLVYTYARFTLDGGWSGLLNVPRMIMLGCGICVNNAQAVLTGLFQHGGEFVRTPKSGSDAVAVRASSYRASHNRLWVIELLLGVYCSITFAVYVLDVHRGVSIFMLLYALGFLSVGWMSRPRGPRPAQDRVAPGAAVTACGPAAGAGPAAARTRESPVDTLVARPAPPAADPALADITA